jgi:rhodanese-related sulfurtransferase
MRLKQVSVKMAYQLQADDDYQYIDVRSIPEYENGHPQGAHNVPLLHADPVTGQMRPNPNFLSVMKSNYPSDAKLLIGCQMGGRSTQAAQALIVAGYQNVSNVLGGFGGERDRSNTGQLINEGWLDAMLPVEQDAPQTSTYSHLQEKAQTKN